MFRGLGNIWENALLKTEIEKDEPKVWYTLLGMGRWLGGSDEMIALQMLEIWVLT